VTGDIAHRTFRDWIGRRWFAPSDLKQYARSGGRLRGVYLPYWTFDCFAESQYTGQRGDDYWTTQTYTTRVKGKTVTRTRPVRKTRWSFASGTVHDRFDDLLVVGSRTLPTSTVRRLAPWDLENLVPYREDFLAGFGAERYQIDLAGSFEIARELMAEPIRRSIRVDIGGDQQRIASVHTSYHDITFKHILLPVWVSAYTYRGRVFRILVNARTGELQGERPYSFWKIALAVLAGLLLAAFIVLVATR
jgi:hypothetical protein